MGNIEITNNKDKDTIKVGDAIVLNTSNSSNDIIQSGSGVMQISRSDKFLSKSCVNGTCLIQTHDGIYIETKNSNVLINGQKCIPCDVLKEYSNTDRSFLSFYEKHCK